ncbi:MULTISPECIES: hypothetical protein [unclassified Aureispira]|uniref:hypothetical protein n=1 Tax=unclassified Aureispira TaxID=2649989 RepID=UPI000696967C|nr:MULTISPECIES: hypothetical protein [unclassified Aureispira]WMX13209.1 hypothetical protein QP953_20405 [Aureispira sp. CCB-E]
MRKLAFYFLSLALVFYTTFACLETKSPNTLSKASKVKILFTPSFLWERVEISLGEEKVIVSSEDFTWDHKKLEHYFLLDQVERDQIDISYIGLNTKFDTTFVLSDSINILNPPHNVTNHYQVEYFNDFKIDTTQNQEGGVVNIEDLYESNYDEYDESFLREWESDTLFILSEIIGDIAYVGYSKYKIYSLEDSCLIEMKSKFYEKSTTSISKIPKLEFEARLKELEESCLEIPFGLCMSSVKIIFVQKNKMITFYDRSCSWDGLKILGKLIKN